MNEDYTYDPTAHRYRDLRTGRFVAWQTVERSLYEFLDAAQDEAAEASRALRAGQIDLGGYEARMMRLIKNVHLTSAALAKGGWAQMAPADYGRAGQVIREQYDFLRRRLEAVQSGAQRLDGTLDQRSRQYVQAGKATTARFLREEMRRRGFDQESNRLDPLADHCQPQKRPGCVEETERGWVPVGDLSLIGQRQCLGGCRCTTLYRNSTTGEVLQ